MEASVLIELLDKHPVTGAIALMCLLIVQQVLKAKKGNDHVSRLERENNALAKQTSETVNKCSQKTEAIIGAIAKHLAENDVGQLFNDIAKALTLLDEMDGRQEVHQRELDRISSLCRYIADDLQKADIRVNHEKLHNKVASVETLAKDVKGICLSIEKGS